MANFAVARRQNSKYIPLIINQMTEDFYLILLQNRR